MLGQIYELREAVAEFVEQRGRRTILKSEEAFKPRDRYFCHSKKKHVVSEQRKKDQKAEDSMVLNAIQSSEDKKYLFGYLGSNFGLRKGDCPHKMLF
ncbi:60S ribosomal protein L6 [Trichinella sp. T6]|nr:60S ribosomal protein L6 [Trichinella sp. T6]